MEAKDALSSVVQELGRHFKPFDMQVDFWRHDPHALPGVGQDAQEVVIRQMPTCDIYVGMLCGRLGTPTARAASGTVEEFLEAQRRFLSTGNPAILFYFCEQPSEGTHEADRIQRARVLEFRDSFPGLFGTFHSVDALRSKFRDHLIDLLLRRVREASPLPRPWLAALAQTVDSSGSQVGYLDRSSCFANRIVEKLRGLADLSVVLHPHEMDTLIAVAHWRALTQRGGLADRLWQQLREAPYADPSLTSAAMEVAALVELPPDPEYREESRVGEVRCCFVAALLQLAELLDLDHGAVAAGSPPTPLEADAGLADWMARHTRRVDVKRPGIVTFHLLVARSEMADEDARVLTRYAALEFEAQWHRRRRVLASNGITATRAPVSVSRSALVAPLPAVVRERMLVAASRASAALPQLLHLSGPEKHWPALTALLPLPCSAVLDRLRVRWDEGRACSLQVWAPGGVAPLAFVPAAQSGEASIAASVLSPATSRCEWQLVEDFGGFASPIARGEAWTLSERDRIRWALVQTNEDAPTRRRWMFSLGLWNDLVEEVWPGIREAEASPEDAELVYQALLASYDWLRDHAPESGRIDTVRNAVGLVREACVHRKGELS